jgi:hypothetical protein
MKGRYSALLFSKVELSFLHPVLLWNALLPRLRNSENNRTFNSKKRTSLRIGDFRMMIQDVLLNPRHFFGEEKYLF